MSNIAKALAFVLALTVGTALAQTVKRSFSVGFRLDHDTAKAGSPIVATVKSGSPVVVKVQIKNTSDHVIYKTGIPHGDIEGEQIGFPPIVRDAGGKEPPLTKWGRLVFGRETLEDKSPGLDLGAVVRMDMPPGDIMNTEVHISDLYDLSAPGKYTIQIRYYDEENKEELKSDPMTVTVVP